jgi:hypothetical protein
MISVKKAVAIGLLGLGLAALIVPAASQTPPDSEAEQKPNELWRLYPLDPESGGQGSTQSDVPASPSLAPAREPDRRGEVAPEDAGGSRAWPSLIAVTLGFAVALLVVVAARRGSRATPSTHATMQNLSTDSSARPNAEAVLENVEAGPASEMGAEPNLVRVHLRDGRMMEGAVKYAPTQDSPVLLLDVVDVSDAEGKKRDPEPFDAFVPLVEIEHVESIDDSEEREPDAWERQ